MGFLKIIALFLILLLGLIVQPILWFIAQFKKKDDFPYYHRLRIFDSPNECCRSYLYDSFASEKIHQEFEDKKIGQFIGVGFLKEYDIRPSVQLLGFSYHKENESPATGIILQCKTCDRLWEYNWPENAYRGYFRPINFSLQEIEPFLKRN